MKTSTPALSQSNKITLPAITRWLFHLYSVHNVFQSLFSWHQGIFLVQHMSRQTYLDPQTHKPIAKYHCCEFVRVCNIKLFWFCSTVRKHDIHASLKERVGLEPVGSYGTDGFTERDTALWRSLIRVNNTASSRTDTHTVRDGDTKTHKNIRVSDYEREEIHKRNMRCVYRITEKKHTQNQEEMQTHTQSLRAGEQNVL